MRKPDYAAMTRAQVIAIAETFRWQRDDYARAMRDCLETIRILADRAQSTKSKEAGNG